MMKPGGNRLKPSKAASNEEGSSNWLTTYSDMMTDLLAIFVILFSFAMMNKPVVNAKSATQQVTSAASAAAAAGQSAASASSGAVPGGQAAQSTPPPHSEKYNSLYKSISAYIKKADLSKQLSVVKEGDNLILVRISESVLFDTGKANINSNANQLLDRISDILTEHGDFIKMVRIEGHTDNRPIKNTQFDSNWELSTSRAVNVLRRLLQTSKLGSAKFSAVGYGEFHPIAKNDTAANMAKNRRVDFVIETVDN